MIKVYKIEQNAEFYYDLALQKKKKGDFGAALELVDEAQSKGESVKFLIERAELYYKLGAYKDSNVIYHRLFAEEAHLEYYLALKRNYFAETGIAGFPLFEFDNFYNNFNFETEQLEQLQDILTESLAIMREIGTEEEEEGFSYFNMRDVKDGRILVDAGEMIKSGRFTEAIIKCGELSDEGTYGIEKLSLLASAAYIGEDYGLCAETSLKLYKRDPENWLAFNLLLLIAKNGGAELPFTFGELSKQMLDALVQKKNIEKLAEYSRLMTSFGENALAYAALKAGYEVAPYHPEMIAMFSIRCFLEGDIKKSLDTIARGKRLFPENYRIILTHSMLNSSQNVKKVEKLLNHGEYSADLYKKLVREVTGANFYKGITPELYELFDVIMANGNEDLIAKSLYKISPRHDEEIKKIILRHLVNDDAYPQIKELLIYMLMLIGGGEEYRVIFFYQGKIVVGYIKTLREALGDQKPLRAAYNMIVTKLLLKDEMPINYDILEDIYSKLSKAGGKPKSPYGLAAIMHYHYDLRADAAELRPTVDYIEDYGTSVKTFKDYLERYSDLIKK